MVKFTGAAIATIALGIACCAVGPTIFALLPDFVMNKIQHMIVLHNDTKIYEIWGEIPVPIHAKFYLFNVTNPDEVVRNQEIPVLEEIGPFVFREHRKKEILGFDNEGNTNETVSYLDWKDYHFEPDMSPYDLDMNLTMINVPLAAVAAIVEQMAASNPDAEFLIMAVDEIIDQYQETMFITTTPRKIIFEGYYDPMVADIMKYAKSVLHIDIPPIIPNNTFGLFYGKNNSADGVYEVNTGYGDYNKYANLVSLNGSSELTYWKTPWCNKINGTDGFQYHPYLTEDDTLYLFATDLCRSIYLKHEQGMYVNGIQAMKFTTPTSLLESPRKNPENECFNLDSRLENMRGVIQLAGCKFGAPILLSFPHFYMGDSCSRNIIDGLNPIKDLHETYITVEPTTGLVIEAAIRLQMNVHLTPTPGIPTYERIIMNLTDAVFPIGWIEESASIDESTTKLLRSMFTTPILVAKGATIALIVLGFLLIVMFIAFVLIDSRGRLT